MQHKKRESLYIEEAFELLETARGSPLTIEERKRTAIYLSGLILREARKTQTHSEKKDQLQLSRMMQDPAVKAFTTAMTDQCFRSSTRKRIADQITYLLQQFGVPQYLFLSNRVGIFLFKLLGNSLYPLLVPLATFLLRKETVRVILPGETNALSKHISLRKE